MGVLVHEFTVLKKIKKKKKIKEKRNKEWVENTHTSHCPFLLPTYIHSLGVPSLGFFHKAIALELL